MVFHIWCDESDKSGKFFSNFYGGVLVRQENLEEVQEEIQKSLNGQNLYKEIKWQKVTDQYLSKYKAVMDTFFKLVEQDKIKVRIMFTSNANRPVNIERTQRKNSYFLLYYQFFKHAFGFKFCNYTDEEVRLRINFDYLPDTKEKRSEFKRYIYRLQHQEEFKKSKIVIDKDHIAEVDSRKHYLLQCMDVVLGSMSFRLNDKHKCIPDGKSRRGKKTIAKERLYKHILSNIRKMRANFNVGITTGKDGDWQNLWAHSYRHWLFVPKGFERDENATKKNSS